MVAINTIGANPIVVANGGTGAVTLTGALVGNGTGAVTAGTLSVANGGTGYAVKPAFLLNLGSDATDVTGDGTSYTIGTGATLTKIYDTGTNATTSGVFTAPVTGKYQLIAQVQVKGNAAVTADTVLLSIVTTARTYTFTQKYLGALASNAVSLSVIADMTATDTASVTIAVSGEAGKTTDITGSASPTTFFCGTLVA